MPEGALVWNTDEPSNPIDVRQNAAGRAQHPEAPRGSGSAKGGAESGRGDRMSENGGYGRASGRRWRPPLNGQRSAPCVLDLAACMGVEDPTVRFVGPLV